MRANNRQIYVFSLYLYLIALPLGAVNIGVLGSALRIVAVMPMLIAIVSVPKFRTNYPILSYTLYVLVCAISVFYSIDITYAWSKFTSIVLLFLLVSSTCCFDFSKHDVEKLKIALVWSSRISVILCLIFNTYVDGRLYFRSDLFNEDPNYFCAYLSFGLIFAIERMLKAERLRVKIVAASEVVLYLSVSLLTGSRGGTIALLFGSVAFIMFSSKRVITAKKTILLVVVGISFYIGAMLLSDEILVRFTIQNINETGGTGRTTIWMNALSMFSKSDLLRKLFGQGIGNTVSAWPVYGIQEKHVCHNMFLESLIEIGIIGLFAYTSMVFAFLRVSFTQSQKYAFGVLVVMVCLSLSTSISTFKPYVNIMIYICCTRHFYK